jgi:hypothetical protein
MIIKQAYSTQMSYEISDAEKAQAEKALILFNHAYKKLDVSSDYLNLMKTPFKDNPDVDPKDVMTARAAIRRFRDHAIDNFNDFKVLCFKCIKTMQDFSSDTQTVKIMKSFISSIDDLEKYVNDFADLFDDLQDKEFAKNVVDKIEVIQKQCDELEDLIKERIKSHIRNNILSQNWVTGIESELNTKIENKKPLMLDMQDQIFEYINKKEQ